MDLDHSLGAGLDVEHVDVLGDHRLEQPAALQVGEGGVRAVRLDVAEAVEPRPVEAPEASRIAPEGIYVGDSIGSTFSQIPFPGVRKSGNPGGHRDPRAGQRNRALALADQLSKLCSGRRGGRRRSHARKAPKNGFAGEARRFEQTPSPAATSRSTWERF